MPPVHHIEQGPDTIRILITTDNHVGYNETDLVRGDDGWKTFQEITYLAKNRDVDMVLQSGDLFHVNKPSKKSIYHVMKSLRLNCLGDRPCELELLSDPSNLLDGGFNTVNYEDPNINVSVPVFAISGNHDDATGEGFLSPLDLLSVSGLINYFGKIPDNESITVSPLLFQKGRSKLALYGMNNVKDERLHRYFRNGEVKFLRPNVQTDQWFNLLALHQNHYQHSMSSFLPESFLPSFLNFVLWGHEHECIPNPVFNPDTGFDTLQPGSSIATSLSEGETAEKHVFILSIKDKEYSIEPVKLRSVRPFVMREVSLQQLGFLPGPASKDDISQYLINEVEKLIEEAHTQYRDTNPDLFEDLDDAEEPEIPLPLVRLRVEYSGDYEVENARRFSNRFVGRIANVNDVLHCYKKKRMNAGPKMVVDDETADFKKSMDNEIFADEATASKASIETYLREFLDESNMSIIPEDGVNEVMRKCIDQDDKTLLNEYIEKTMKVSLSSLMKIDIDDHELYDGDEENTRAAFKNVLNTFKRENNLKKQIDQIKPFPLKPSTDSMNVDAAAPTAKENIIIKPRGGGRRAAPKRKAAPKSSLVVGGDEDQEDSEIDEYRDQQAHLDVAASDSDEGEEPAPRQKTPSSRRAETAKKASAPSKRTVGRDTKKSSSVAQEKPRGKNSNSLLDDIINLGKK